MHDVALVSSYAAAQQVSKPWMNTRSFPNLATQNCDAEIVLNRQGKPFQTGKVGKRMLVVVTALTELSEGDGELQSAEERKQ